VSDLRGPPGALGLPSCGGRGRAAPFVSRGVASADQPGGERSISSGIFRAGRHNCLLCHFRTSAVGGASELSSLITPQGCGRLSLSVSLMKRRPRPPLFALLVTAAMFSSSAEAGLMISSEPVATPTCGSFEAVLNTLNDPHAVPVLAEVQGSSLAGSPSLSNSTGSFVSGAVCGSGRFASSATPSEILAIFSPILPPNPDLDGLIKPPQV
jgi:hypothetical protein